MLRKACAFLKKLAIPFSIPKKKPKRFSFGQAPQVNGLFFWGLKTKSHGTSPSEDLAGPCSTTTHLDAMFGATNFGAAETQFKKM